MYIHVRVHVPGMYMYVHVRVLTTYMIVRHGTCRCTQNKYSRLRPGSQHLASLRLLIDGVEFAGQKLECQGRRRLGRRAR